MNRVEQHTLDRALLHETHEPTGKQRDEEGRTTKVTLDMGGERSRVGDAVV